MITKLLCWIGIHERTNVRYPTGAYLYGFAYYGNPNGICIHCGDKK